MNWDTAPQELDDLRAQVTALKDQLATMMQERNRWQEDSMRQAATINRMSAAAEDRNEVDQLRHAEHEKELAAAQAQIAQLREALKNENDLHEALYIPIDTADARLAQERERCAVVA